MGGRGVDVSSLGGGCEGAGAWRWCVTCVQPSASGFCEGMGCGVFGHVLNGVISLASVCGRASRCRFLCVS